MVWVIAYLNANSEPLMWKMQIKENLACHTIDGMIDSALMYFQQKYPQLGVDGSKKHTYECCISTKEKWRCGFSAWTRLIYSKALLSHFIEKDDDAFEINVIPGYVVDSEVKEKVVWDIIGYKAPPDCDFSRDSVEEDKYTAKRKRFWKNLEKEMFREEWGFSSSEEEQEKPKKKAKKGTSYIN